MRWRLTCCGILDDWHSAWHFQGPGECWLNKGQNDDLWALLSDSLDLFHFLPLTFPPTPAPSLQTELSLQKEQLQLKIIEIEDEAEKWQKEKDRIKVSSAHDLPPVRPGGGRPGPELLLKVSGPHLHPTLVSSGFFYPFWHFHKFAF